jgi:hypothetical protein
VTITGTNLAAASSVELGSTPAGFSIDSGSELTATVPAGASSGTWSVSTPGGTATSGGGFTVTSSGGVAPTAPTVHPSISLRSATVTAKRRSAPIQLSCRGAACKGTATLSVKHGRRTIVVARRAYTLRAGANASVTLQVTRAGRHALSASRRLRAMLRLTVRGGKAVSRRVSVRR